MKTIQIIALFFTIIGGINWGLIGLFDFNLVSLIFGGQDSVLTKLIYIIVGISSILMVFERDFVFKFCKI